MTKPVFKKNRHTIIDPDLGEMTVTVTVNTTDGSCRVRWDLPKAVLWRLCYFWNGEKNPSVAFTPQGN